MKIRFKLYDTAMVVHQNNTLAKNKVGIWPHNTFKNHLINKLFLHAWLIYMYWLNYVWLTELLLHFANFYNDCIILIQTPIYVCSYHLINSIILAIGALSGCAHYQHLIVDRFPGKRQYTMIYIYVLQK